MATAIPSRAAPLPGELATLLVAFLALSFLVMGLHELTHHFAARAACGAWGVMTLSQFFASENCMADGRPWWLATLAGPVLTYSLIAIGAAWRSRWGLVLLFANLPLARLATAVGGGGDELMVARLAMGDAAWPVTIAISAALLAWPLWTAWKRLPERRRALVFAGLLMVPLIWDFTFKRLFLGPLLPAEPSIAGMPIAVLACDLLALIVLAAAVRASPTRSASS